MTPGTAPLAELFADTPEELRRQALSHSSWVETRTESYGRLAFLGDSVLGLSVGEPPLRRRIRTPTSGSSPRSSTRPSAAAPAPRSLASSGLPELLAERAPDDGDGLPVETLLASERTLASVCEAVIGACYLAHGFERTSRRRSWTPSRDEIEQATRERLDFKSELQERLARDGETVNYEVANEEGPPHDRRFEVRATVGGDELGVGSGRSKKEAEQAAAAARPGEAAHA